jgi:hypothetical protein
MSSVVIAGDTSGTITLAAPAVSGTTTLTLPATTDTLVGKTTTDTLTNKTLTSPTITGATITVASTAAPAFSAYANAGSTQSIGAGVYTKITLGAESFDTNNNFASSTFTPTVAGYYQLSFAVGGNVNTETLSCLYKNGGLWHYGSDAPNSYISTGSAVVYANGSTDYFELYAFTVLANNIYQNINRTYFTGAMIRSA